MKLLSEGTYDERKILYIPLTFFLLIVLVEIITIPFLMVSFYILNDNIKDKLISLLEGFKHTLPQDVKLEVYH